LMTRASRDAAAFLCSCGYILAIFASAAFGQHPYLLPAISVGQNGLTIFDASTSYSGLAIGLYWFIPGVILAGIYSIFAYRWLFAESTSE
jgi:cytochrome bd ubiquinol oxidase subunit II